MKRYTESMVPYIEDVGAAAIDLHRSVESRSESAVLRCCLRLRETISAGPYGGMPGQHVIDAVADLEARVRGSFEESDRPYYLAVVRSIESQIELAEEELES